MIVVTDVDGIVSDFVGACSAITGHDRALAISWDWFKRFPAEDIQKTKKTLSSPNFWERMPLMPNAVEGVKFLRDNGHQIIWCTQRFQGCFGWADAREHWLESNFHISMFNEPIITTTHHEIKRHVSGLVFIDDKADTVVEWQAHNPQGIGLTFDSEMNRHLGIKNLITWESLMKMSLFQKKKENE